MNRLMQVMLRKGCLMRQFAEVFTSPTPDKVLEAIKAVDTGDGVLLIVKIMLAM